MVKKKYEIEAALHAESQAISAGRLKEDNPLDLSDDFRLFCEACRRGDLKVCQEMITKGVNINARDKFDYTPLILVGISLRDLFRLISHEVLPSPTSLSQTRQCDIANLCMHKASLCGHFEVAQLLLESGALCERDTFQGERCLYNALNDRIRNLLLSYDYAKSTDPLQPLAAHITSLLSREHPKTTDITLVAPTESFALHKFVLSARSPYFAKKLATAPDTILWKLSESIPTDSLQAALRYLYFAEVSADLGDGEEEQIILTGIEKICRQLEIERMFEGILDSGDRRMSRQRRTEEVNRGRDQLHSWFRDNVLKNRIVVDTPKVEDVRWDRHNGIFADVLLRADEEPEEEQENDTQPRAPLIRNTSGHLMGIPIGPMGKSRSPSRHRTPRKSALYPVHRAMLLRSEYFLTMFSSSFREAQETPHLQIVKLDCTPAVLEVILTFLYTERANFGLDVAIDVLFMADLLFIDKLKQKAAMIISSLGNGSAGLVDVEDPQRATGVEEVLDIYEVVRAGWDTRVHRLEEFGARYIAYRLERYIDEEEFAELVTESANRIAARQETDTVELVDE
jgi:hypothetical protein